MPGQDLTSGVVAADAPDTDEKDFRSNGEFAAPGSTPGEMAVVPLYDNDYVLAPLATGQSQVDLIEEAKRMAIADRDTLDMFDLPERERMYALAT